MLAGCVAQPELPAPDRAGVAGRARLVPHEGALEHASPSPGYGDRRLRHATLVDYSTPGFVVVYLDDDTPPPGEMVRLAVEPGLARAVLAPRFAAVGVGGSVAIANRTDAPVVLSAPDVARVERLEPGAELVLAPERAGPFSIFVLGSDESSTVFASPGPWTRVEPSGRYALGDLRPGRFVLRAWHPRLPTAAAEVVLRAGEIAEVDFEIGVGRGEGAHAAH